eukprot:4509293-Amphidinium_carterae.1
MLIKPLDVEIDVRELNGVLVLVELEVDVQDDVDVVDVVLDELDDDVLLDVLLDVLDDDVLLDVLLDELVE